MMMMKKKGYAKGGMKKKGYAKGGMPMNPETGTPTFVGDGKGKMAGGGSAMKKKGYANGGAASKALLPDSLSSTQSRNTISNRDVAFLKKMLAAKESGKSVSDADKKIIEAMKRKGGGSAMKKKGYAKGGMKKKGYAKGGMKKKGYAKGGATRIF